MTKREELDLFISKANELIESKYILADVRIANLLKSIAGSETLIAIFRNCLTDFNYEQAKSKYLGKSKFLSSDKGELITPDRSGELLAFTLCLLNEIDAKSLDFGEFLNKYCYQDGSFSSSYTEFIERLIKPFKNAVVLLMDGVISGNVQDPEEAFCEKIKEREQKEKELIDKKLKEEELSKKTFGENVKKIKKLLLADKNKINNKKIKEYKKEEMLLSIDMLANVLDSMEKDAVFYALVCYKNVMKSYSLSLFSNRKKVQKLTRAVLNEI